MKLDFDNISYSEARGYKEALEQLFDSPGWQFFIKFQKERMALKEQDLISSCPESIEQMVRYARIRGNLDEIGLIETIIRQVHEDLTEAVQRMQEEGQDDG